MNKLLCKILGHRYTPKYYNEHLDEVICVRCGNRLEFYMKLDKWEPIINKND